MPMPDDAPSETPVELDELKKMLGQVIAGQHALNETVQAQAAEINSLRSQNEDLRRGSKTREAGLEYHDHARGLSDEEAWRRMERPGGLLGG